ncbi:MAG: hypothetical protein Q4F53_10775 [Nesterenkonia sp.]|uniref:hypothetical protein n=1 Tax=Nesterenkonia marinintestina TaxID=2979865 RepID=UPI0021BF4011|nr:hypothetical protein [Nesterenkonia sp. GX14115]MDO5494074.1 hypothetical protein [Nesterenkonia sp.]
MSTQSLISPDLARAGRALAQVSAAVIADAADLERDQVREFEKRRRPLHDEQIRRLQAALERFGVVFIPEDDDHGYGVRQKFNSRKVRQIERWEGEGGPVGDDDI